MLRALIIICVCCHGETKVLCKWRRGVGGSITDNNNDITLYIIVLNQRQCIHNIQNNMVAKTRNRRFEFLLRFRFVKCIRLFILCVYIIWYIHIRLSIYVDESAKTILIMYHLQCVFFLDLFYLFTFAQFVVRREKRCIIRFSDAQSLKKLIGSNIRLKNSNFCFLN